MRPFWDGLGITAAAACAIHCAVLPLLFTSLPLLGINVIHNPAFEYGMIALALGIGIVALRHGYKLHHHNWRPTALLAVGFVFLITKEVLPGYQTGLVLMALLCIVTAHVYNFQLCRKANHCHPNDCNH
jgi:hypothetical protein